MSNDHFALFIDLEADTWKSILSKKKEKFSRKELEQVSDVNKMHSQGYYVVFFNISQIKKKKIAAKLKELGLKYHLLTDKKVQLSVFSQ